MRRLNIFFLVIVILLPSGVLAQKITEKFKDREFVDKQGDTLNYRIHIPDRADSTGSYPLVLFLHGAGERGNDNKAQLTWGVWRFVEDSVQQDHPSIVVVPQAPKGKYWGRIDWRESLKMTNQPSKPLALTIKLLKQLQKDYAIDTKRMYVTGLSMGGFGTWDLISRYPDMFAAAVPVCGGGDTRQAHLLANLPIWNFHGAIDDVVPPRHSRDMIEAIQYAGGVPGYTEYPGVGHFSWIPAYREPRLVDWMFSKSTATNLGKDE